jgi:hypothetical protein
VELSNFDLANDLEMGKKQNTMINIASQVQLSDKQIVEYFETPKRNVHVTSIEINKDDLNYSDLEAPNKSKEEEAIQKEQEERENIIRHRKKYLAQKKKERKSKVKEDTLYKYNRDEMIEKVSKIIHQHIIFAETKIKFPSQGAMLFDEKIYKRERWMAHTAHGFSATLPVFLYSLERVEYEVKE